MVCWMTCSCQKSEEVEVRVHTMDGIAVEVVAKISQGEFVPKEKLLLG